MSPVAWATSTTPVTDSTFGQFKRVHASYSKGRASGSIATDPDGLNSGAGAAECLPATKSSSISSGRVCNSRAIRSAATAVPPGVGCQHCSRVYATRTFELTGPILAAFGASTVRGSTQRAPLTSPGPFWRARPPWENQSVKPSRPPPLLRGMRGPRYQSSRVR